MTNHAINAKLLITMILILMKKIKQILVFSCIFKPNNRSSANLEEMENLEKRAYEVGRYGGKAAIQLDEESYPFFQMLPPFLEEVAPGSLQKTTFPPQAIRTIILEVGNYSSFASTIASKCLSCCKKRAYGGS